MAAIWLTKLAHKVMRKKTLEGDMMETRMNRCLTSADLTFLGLGQMIGAGIFVLTGTVMKDIAGPAVVVCYLLAGVAATLASLCYAEFGARVPKTGSAYVYSYVTIGEFCAFLIGWCMVLEYLIAAASLARGFSASLDSLFNGAIRNSTINTVGMFPEGHIMGDYPDFLAMASVLVTMIPLSMGVVLSVNINAIFTVINVVVIFIIMVVGWYYGDMKNYHEPNGFMPFGFQGIVSGTASCFFAYAGFECIAMAGEEAEKPEKSIPRATIVAMAAVTLLYVGASSALAKLVPYNIVNPAAPFPMAFAMYGMQWMKYAVAMGALLGISSSLIGSLYALPRAVYAMSADGLFFRVFTRLSFKHQSPVLAMVVFGSLASVAALLFDIEILVEFLSIGLLLSFTMVGVSVLIVRYQTADACVFPMRDEDDTEAETPVSDVSSDKRHIISTSQSHSDIGKLYGTFRNVPFLKNVEHGKIPPLAITGFVISCVVFNAVLLPGFKYLSASCWWSVGLAVVSGLGMLVSLVLLMMHERNKSFITFQMPLIPYIPAMSIFVNIGLMMMLKPMTWIRLAVSIIIGCFIYFLYGIHNSNENRSLASYDHIINYNGNSDSIPTTLEESLHVQQPPSDVRRISYRRQSTEPEQED